jgi:N utilization substance protein B
MKKHIKKLHKSRKLLLQSLYGLTLNKENNTQDLIRLKNKNKINLKYLDNSIKTIIKKNSILELIIKTYTQNYNIDLIEKLILKIATFEFFFNRKIPPKVIINESINLSKIFCNQKSHKMINKILDKIIKNK